MTILKVPFTELAAGWLLRWEFVQFSAVTGLLTCGLSTAFLDGLVSKILPRINEWGSADGLTFRTVTFLDWSSSRVGLSENDMVTDKLARMRVRWLWAHTGHLTSGVKPSKVG